MMKSQIEGRMMPHLCICHESVLGIWEKIRRINMHVMDSGSFLLKENCGSNNLGFSFGRVQNLFLSSEILELQNMNAYILPLISRNW